jgi:isoleucyl-tRNA synthetase
MSVALTGRAPFVSVLGYEKMLDEHGREMHGSWGNLIPAEEAFTRMGADVMRWQYCQQPPDRDLLFGYGPAHEIKRKLLTLWNSASFLITYANTPDVQFTPQYTDLEAGPAGIGLEAIDLWLLARTSQFVERATGALEDQLTYRLIDEFERFVDDVSNWYIRRNRPRFWRGDEGAFRTLWYALVQADRVVSPVMPFLAEHLWRTLVGGPCADAPESVFLSGWPEPSSERQNERLLAEMDEARRVVDLGRRAREAAEIKLRQPLRRLVVQGAAVAERHAGVICDELRVKEIDFGEVESTQLRVKPNLPVLGPKLGKELRAVRTALEAGDFEELPNGAFRAAGHELRPEEVLVEQVGRPGFRAVSENGITVALDTELDDELRLEGRVLDLIHRINLMRKEAGLDLTDRIVLTLPDESDLRRHEDWIKAETLATRIEAGSELAIAKD